ncbi:MAG: dephospho-CoA kinase [Desulfovibrionaceae bacterium]
MSRESAERRFERRAGDADAGLRLDRFWARELAAEGVSRERVQAWIAEGRALVDGDPARKPGLRLAGGEVLELRADPAPAAELPPDPGDLAVVHADAALVVVDKPAGLTVHPAPGEPGPTLAHRLVHHFPDLAALDPERPGIVHRLDKGTSGLMAVARTEAARLKLAGDFATRRVRKVYLAVVHGRPEPVAGRIDAPIGRDPRSRTRMAVAAKGGRLARSDWRVLWTDPDGRLSLAAVRIHTGRTHQIRVHMAHLGHPLLGDETYGAREHAEWRRAGGPLADLAPRPMLHAFRLDLDHPVTGERLAFRADPPEDFLALLSAAGRRCLRVGIVGLPACGKSALLADLRDLGGPCFSADAEVAALYAPGGDGAAVLSRRWGPEVLAPDGAVDKRALFARMCASEAFRREVMDLVHPLVEHRAEAFFAAHAAAPVAWAEIPLLLEGGWPGRGRVDVVAGVWCPDEVRRARAAARGLAPEALARLDAWQWPGPDKLRACQFVVDNSGGREALRARAAGLARLARRLAGARAEAWAARLRALLDGAAAGAGL